MVTHPRIFYGYWLVVAGFVTQFLSVGAMNYSIGVRHGTGTEYRADGTVALSGRWDQGQYIEP